MKPYHLNLLFINDTGISPSYPRVYVAIGHSINVERQTGRTRAIGYTSQTRSEFDGMIDQFIAELETIREQAHQKFAKINLLGCPLRATE